MRTCPFAAWPVPTTVFFMRLAAYSPTTMPRKAGAKRQTPRAWPRRRVELGFLLTKSPRPPRRPARGRRARRSVRRAVGTTARPAAATPWSRRRRWQHGSGGYRRPRSHPSRCVADPGPVRGVSCGVVSGPARQALNFSKTSSATSKFAATDCTSSLSSRASINFRMVTAFSSSTSTARRLPRDFGPVGVAKLRLQRVSHGVEGVERASQLVPIGIGVALVRPGLDCRLQHASSPAAALGKWIAPTRLN